MFDSINPNKLHHAYAIEGGERVREELLRTLEGSWKITIKGNPDFSYQKYETLNIEEARNLKAWQETKAFAPNGKKIFVIEANSITIEAQNSLLKMFEEPNKNTHFFLLGASVKNLIPTLVSRFSTLNLEAASAPQSGAEASEFLRSSLPKRLILVKKLADDIKNEKKTKTNALVILQDIEAILYHKAKTEGKLPHKLFEDLEMCRNYMSDRSASVKMLLEYVALVTPHHF